MMKRWFGLVLWFWLSFSWAENVTFEEAGDAARQVEIPNFADLITQDRLTDTLPPTSFGDTSSLSQMRGETGMGDIKTPGLNKAIACEDKNDPECLAIQMLRYGSANHPEFDESTANQIKGEYNTAIGNKDAILGELTNLGSQTRVCETIETVIAGQSATEVCDITTGEASSTGSCEEGWEESKSLLVYYQCTMKALSVDNTCTVTTTPITHTEDIYQCTDRAATDENRTCDVPATVNVTRTYPYTCPIKKAAETKKTCTRSLWLYVTPTCSGSSMRSLGFDFEDFTGWAPSRNSSSINVMMPCQDTYEFHVYTGRSASRDTVYITQFPSIPSSVTVVIEGETFKIDLRFIEIDYIRYYEATVTHPSSGISQTQSTQALISVPYGREVWSETCEEVAS